MSATSARPVWRRAARAQDVRMIAIPMSWRATRLARSGGRSGRARRSPGQDRRRDELPQHRCRLLVRHGAAEQARNGCAGLGRPRPKRKKRTIRSPSPSVPGREQRRDHHGRVDRQLHRGAEQVLLGAEVVVHHAGSTPASRRWPAGWRRVAGVGEHLAGGVEDRLLRPRLPAAGPYAPRLGRAAAQGRRAEREHHERAAADDQMSRRSASAIGVGAADLGRGRRRRRSGAGRR